MAENPSPSTSTSTTTTPAAEQYQPRDPMFYGLAAGMIAAALRPDTLAESDAEAAEKIGHTCARALDRGVVPEGFLMPKTRRMLDFVHRRDLLQSGETDRPLGTARHAVIMTEGEKQREREALQKVGTIPSREELMGQNAKQIAALANLSEPVRHNALHQAALRITAKPHVTGAREQEALVIVVEEIDAALRIHAAIGNPTVDLESDGGILPDDPSRSLPYPGNVVTDLLRAGAASALGAPTAGELEPEPPAAPKAPAGAPV